ncbi:MAG: ROK family protein [Verrucomicrobia bacterium]|nr:ROK family protein [Verrucomicrobiota bacterium]
MKALGIDIGGSAIKGAPVDTRTGRLLAERYRIEVDRRTTPAALAKAAAEITAHFKWRGRVGVGFPGVVEGARIRTAANLHPRFVGCDAARLFGRATGCRVAMINDAAAAAVAEMRFGAGRGFLGKVLFLTLGTGVGTCLAYQGVVYPLEFGHFPWKGGRDAEKYVSTAARDRKDLSWEEWGDRLHDFIAELERLMWPELIIIGGGASSKHEKFFRHIRPRARLVPARLLNRAGIAGAAWWAAETLG